MWSQVQSDLERLLAAKVYPLLLSDAVYRHFLMFAGLGPNSLAAGPAMSAWLGSTAPADYPHGLGLTAKRICQLAIEGDEVARSAVSREARYLGLGLANLINLFTPDAIVLSGSIMKSSSLFLDGIHETVRQGCRFVPLQKTELLLASLGEKANLIGAAMVWHHRFGRVMEYTT